jgi:hypothetical protein
MTAAHTGQVAEPDGSNCGYEVAVRTPRPNPLPVPPRGAPGWSFVERPHETTTGNDHPLTNHRSPVIPLCAPSRASLGTRQRRSRSSEAPPTSPPETPPRRAATSANNRTARRPRSGLSGKSVGGNNLNSIDFDITIRGQRKSPKDTASRKTLSTHICRFQGPVLTHGEKVLRKLLPIEMTFLTASPATFSEPISTKRPPIPQTGRPVLASPQAHSPPLQSELRA